MLATVSHRGSVSLTLWSLYDSEVNSGDPPAVTPCPVGSGSVPLFAAPLLHGDRGQKADRRTGGTFGRTAAQGSDSLSGWFGGGLVPLLAPAVRHGAEAASLSPAPHHPSGGRHTERVQ